MRLSGFLFLFIIATNVASVALGYRIDDYDSDAKLQQIVDDPRKFRLSIVLALIEHVSIIGLALLLFIVFSPHNLILGIVWIIFRTGEGMIQIYSEFNFRRLLNLARQYPGAGAAEKNGLIDKGRVILQTKNQRYQVAMILFGIGTLAYSIVFVTYGVVPTILGWLGILAGIFDVLGNGIRLVRSDSKVMAYIGGLLTLVFELIIGGWLLFFSHSIS